MEKMSELEARYGYSEPLLVHGDLQVVDAGLKLISSSFMQYQGIAHEDDGLQTLLLSNFVTGCTCLLNRQLAELALPVPQAAIVHDWWMALCAASAGHIGYIAEPLVKYRQHGANAIGAKNAASRNPLSPDDVSFRNELVRKTVLQADALSQRLHQRSLSGPTVDGALAAYIRILQMPRFLRPFILLKHRIGPPRPGAPAWRKWTRLLRFAWVVSTQV